MEVNNERQWEVLVANAQVVCSACRRCGSMVGELDPIGNVQQGNLNCAYRRRCAGDLFVSVSKPEYSRRRATQTSLNGGKTAGPGGSPAKPSTPSLASPPPKPALTTSPGWCASTGRSRPTTTSATSPSPKTMPPAAPATAAVRAVAYRCGLGGRGGTGRGGGCSWWAGFASASAFPGGAAAFLGALDAAAGGGERGPADGAGACLIRHGR